MVTLNCIRILEEVLVLVHCLILTPVSGFWNVPNGCRILSGNFPVLHSDLEFKFVATCLIKFNDFVANVGRLTQLATYFKVFTMTQR